MGVGAAATLAAGHITTIASANRSSASVAVATAAARVQGLPPHLRQKVGERDLHVGWVRHRHFLN